MACTVLTCMVVAGCGDDDTNETSGPGATQPGAGVASSSLDDEVGLVGTLWQLDGLVDGETITSVPTGVDPPTLQLDEEGAAALFLGCNRGGATFERSGSEQRGVLVVGPIRSTKMACDEPAMATEAAVIAVLGSEPRYEVGMEALTLTAPDGRGLRFTAV